MIDDTFRAASDKISLSESISLWRARDIEDWSRSPEIYLSLAEKVLAQGEFLLAYDVVSEALAKWPENVRFRQLQGLALARSGATERANAALEKLRQEGQTDEETLGMLARTYKDLAARATSVEERQDCLGRAAEIYTQAYQSSGGNWSGINAATMSLLVGQTERATRIAEQVQRQCRKALSQDGNQYWLLAALGEAALILRKWKEAEEWYERAAKKSGRRFGDLASTRRNARLIFQHWKTDPRKIENYLRVPPVVVFSGHMIDSPERIAPRFPASLEPAVAKALFDKIRQLKPGVGFASAACGSDILFLEAMLDVGAEISVVLPYNKDEFIRDSVDLLPGSNWSVRFEHVLKQAAQLVTASTDRLHFGSISLEFGNALLFGLATLYAARLEADMVPLAVWDGKSGDGPGGTASAIGNWQHLGYKPEIIDLTQFSQPAATVSPTVIVGCNDEPSKAKTANEFTPRIVAILFADAVGFSKLSEDEVPRFVQHFLGPIAQLSRTLGEGLIAKNTWGDGLYFVFSDVHLAGKFALELADVVSATSWQDKGLRSGLSLRIALHAGPVYEFDDPITGSRSYSGTHVSRAARIEPITPPGQVYASEAFAALAAARGGGGFSCDYVGQTPLAKGYGTLPMYHVRWRAVAARL
jgi:class 3 adenylate cyclase/tetratricopeptide (TPR) repeat protein